MKTTEKQRSWIILSGCALVVILLVCNMGCLATVQQKAIRLAEITETGYAIIKADLIDWKARYDNISIIFALKCAENPGSDRCNRLAKADKKAQEVWTKAQDVDASAKDLGAAKNELVSLLLEMEKALMADPPSVDPHTPLGG